MAVSGVHSHACTQKDLTPFIDLRAVVEVLDLFTGEPGHLGDFSHPFTPKVNMATSSESRVLVGGRGFVLACVRPPEAKYWGCSKFYGSAGGQLQFCCCVKMNNVCLLQHLFWEKGESNFSGWGAGTPWNLERECSSWPLVLFSRVPFSTLCSVPISNPGSPGDDNILYFESTFPKQ